MCVQERIARGLHRLCGRGQRVRVPDTGVDVLRVRHTGGQGRVSKMGMAHSASHGKGFNKLLYF
jgi:hypothetical protein